MLTWKQYAAGAIALAFAMTMLGERAVAQEPGISCNVEMTQDSYGFGEGIVAGTVSLSNTTPVAADVTVIFFLIFPGGQIGSLSVFGTIDAGLEQNFGPQLLAVLDGQPKPSDLSFAVPGYYTFGCRVEEAEFGEILATDFDTFGVLLDFADE